MKKSQFCFKQTNTQINDNINSFYTNIDNKLKYRVQKIFSTVHFFIFHIYGAGEKTCMYIGRGGDYQGVWFSELQSNSYMRINDRDREYIKSKFKNRVILDIISFQSHIGFSISLFDKDVIFIYDDNKLNLFEFVKQENDYLLTSVSLGIKEKVIKQLPIDYIENIFISRPRIKGFVNTISDYLSNYHEIIYPLKNVVKVNKKKEKKILNIKKDIKKIEEIISLKNDLILDSLYLENNVLKINENIIKLPKGSIWDKKNYLFTKIKKLSPVLIKMNARLVDTTNSKKEVVKKQPILLKWVNIKKKNNFLSFKYMNSLFYIGRNWRENNLICSKIASKSDIWFHLEGEPGAHLFLKNSENIEVESILLQIIGSVLIEYSKLSILEARIIQANVSDIKFITKGKGRVHYKNEKIIKIHYLPSWREIITVL